VLEGPDGHTRIADMARGYTIGPMAKKKKKRKASGGAGAAPEPEGASELQQTRAGCFAEDGTYDIFLDQKRQIDALEKKMWSMETDLGVERALRMELEDMHGVCTK
jgi:hypothetical protein